MSLRKPITPRLSPWAQRSLVHLTDSARPSATRRPRAGYGGGVGLLTRMTVSRLGGTVMRVTAAPNPEQPSARALVSPFSAAVLKRFAATATLPKRYALAPRDVPGEPVSQLPLPGVGAVQRQPQSGEGRGEMSLEALAALFAQETSGAPLPAGSEAPGVQRAPGPASTGPMPAFDELASRVQQANRGGFAAPEPRADSPASAEASGAGPAGASPPAVQRAAASQGRGFSVADQIRERIRQAEVQREAAASSGAPPPAPTNMPAPSAQEPPASASSTSTSIVGEGASAPPSERVQRATADTPASPPREGDQERPELLPISTQEGDPGYSRAAALTERIQRIRQGPRQPLKRSADPQDPNFSRVSALQARIQRASEARSAAGEAPVRPELPQSLDPSSQHYSRTADIRARIEQARTAPRPRPAPDAGPAIQRQPAMSPGQQTPAETPPAAAEPASQDELAEAGGSMASAIRARIEAARARRDTGDIRDAGETAGAPSTPSASSEQVQRAAAATPLPPADPGAEAHTSASAQTGASPPSSGSVAQEIRARIQAARERAENPPASPTDASADVPIQRQTITGAPPSSEESGPDAAEIAARIQATRDRATARPAASSPPPGQDAPPIQRTPDPSADASAASSTSDSTSEDVADASQSGPVSPRAAAARRGFSIADEIARRVQEPPAGAVPPAPAGDSETPSSPARAEVQRSPVPPDGEPQPPPSTTPSATPSTSASTPPARPVRQGVLREGPGTASWQRPQVQRTRMFSRTEVLTPERKRPLSALLQPDTGTESAGPPAGDASGDTVQRAPGAEPGQTIDHAPREDRDGSQEDGSQEDDTDSAPSLQTAAATAPPGQTDAGQTDVGQANANVQRATVTPDIAQDAPVPPSPDAADAPEDAVQRSQEFQVSAAPATADVEPVSLPAPPEPPAPVQSVEEETRGALVPRAPESAPPIQKAEIAPPRASEADAPDTPAAPDTPDVQRTPDAQEGAPSIDVPSPRALSNVDVSGSDAPATDSSVTESRAAESPPPDLSAGDLPAAGAPAPMQRQSAATPPTSRAPDSPAQDTQPPAPADVQRSSETQTRPGPAASRPEGRAPAATAVEPESVPRQQSDARPAPPASAGAPDARAPSPETPAPAIQRAPAEPQERQDPLDAADMSPQPAASVSAPHAATAADTAAPTAALQRAGAEESADTRAGPEDRPAPAAPTSPVDGAPRRDVPAASQDASHATGAAPQAGLTETVSRQVDAPAHVPLDESSPEGASAESLSPSAPSARPTPETPTRASSRAESGVQRAPAPAAETETPAGVQRVPEDTGPLSHDRDRQPAPQDKTMQGPTAPEDGTIAGPIQRADAPEPVAAPPQTPSRSAEQPAPARDDASMPGSGVEVRVAPASPSADAAAPNIQRVSPPPSAPGERPAPRPDAQTPTPSPDRGPEPAPAEPPLAAAELAISRPPVAPSMHLFDRLQRFVDAQMGPVQRQSAPAARLAVSSPPAAASSTEAASTLAEQHAASRHLLQLERVAQEEATRRVGRRHDRPLIQRTTDPRLLARRGKTSRRRASPAILPQTRRGAVQRAWEDGKVDDSGRPLPLARIGAHRQRAPSSEPESGRDSSAGDEFSGAVSSAPGGNALPTSTPIQSQVDQSVQDSMSTTSAFTSARPRSFGGGSPGGKRMDGPNLDEIARQILPLIRRMLAVERERRPSR